MKKNVHLMIILCVVINLISACGGGGGGGGTQESAPTNATVKLKTSGTGTTIYGIDVTVDLAPGVTLKSTNPPYVDTDGVTLSGVASSSTMTAVYTASTGSVPGKVRVLIANANGFSAGEFCQVSGIIATGYSPKSTDFTIEKFSASDMNGNTITGMTPEFVAEMQ